MSQSEAMPAVDLTPEPAVQRMTLNPRIRQIHICRVAGSTEFAWGCEDCGDNGLATDQVDLGCKIAHHVDHCTC